MRSPQLSPYEDPAAHARISALIRDHSSNREDVRRALMRSLDFSGAQDILDLGCGFGFWTEELATKVAPTARFTGIDACEGNKRSYLSNIEPSGRRARFMCASLSSHLPFEDDSFDLVVAAYSLYFFVDIVPDVGRVLRPEGHFLAVTHSEHSFDGLLSAMELPEGDSPLECLVRRFSSEHGQSLLDDSFARVERVDYANTLTFGADELDDFLAYLHFKMPLLNPGSHYREELSEALVAGVETWLRRGGGVTVQKNDTLFICGGSDGR